MLVSLSAAIFVISAEQAALRHGEVADIVRAMTGIAQGVGFLGAGAIVQSRREVRWLTTAASFWAAAALGFAAGAGMYLVAILGGLLVFATLRWLLLAEKRWLKTADVPDQGKPRER